LIAVDYHYIHSADSVREFIAREPALVFVKVLLRIGFTTSYVEDEALPDLRLEVRDVVALMIFLPLRGLSTSVSYFSVERRLVVICFLMTLPFMGATSTLV
jgi:hypothetical protein